MKNLFELRKYYKCKECLSHGAIDNMLVAKCPICGSRQLSFYGSEAEFVKRERSDDYSTN